MCCLGGIGLRRALLTLEGHPLAGAVRFMADPLGAAVRFQVEVYDRAASMIDLIAMRTLGDTLQAHTWTKVVENMIAHSGGQAPAGVQHASASLDDEDAKREFWAAFRPTAPIFDLFRDIVVSGGKK